MGPRMRSGAMFAATTSARLVFLGSLVLGIRALALSARVGTDVAVSKGGCGTESHAILYLPRYFSVKSSFKTCISGCNIDRHGLQVLCKCMRIKLLKAFGWSLKPSSAKACAHERVFMTLLMTRCTMEITTLAGTLLCLTFSSSTLNRRLNNRLYPLKTCVSQGCRSHVSFGGTRQIQILYSAAAANTSGCV